MSKNSIYIILIISLPIYTISDQQTTETDLVKRLKENIIFNHKPEDFNTYSQLYLVKWLNEAPHSIINNFIKYAKDDLSESEKIIKRAVEWRRSNQMETIMNWIPPEYIQVNFPYCVSKSHHENTSAIIIAFEKWNIKNAIRKGYKTHLLKFVLQIIEKNLKKNAIGHNDIIINFSKFSYSQVASINGISFICILTEILRDVYPNHNTFYSEEVPIFIQFLDLVFGISSKNKEKHKCDFSLI